MRVKAATFPELQDTSRVTHQLMIENCGLSFDQSVGGLMMVRTCVE